MGIRGASETENANGVEGGWLKNKTKEATLDIKEFSAPLLTLGCTEKKVNRNTGFQKYNIINMKNHIWTN